MHYQILSNIFSFCWFLTILFILTTKWKKLSLPSKSVYGIYFIVKLLSLLFFIWLYTDYYETGDFYFYKNYLEGTAQFSGNYRTQAFVKILEIIYFFSFKNYMLTNINLCLIATISSLKVFDLSLKKQPFYLILFTPTLLLWTSGVTKETMILISTNYAIYYNIKFIKYSRKGALIISTLGCLLTISIKPYIGVPLFLILAYEVIRCKYPKLLRIYLSVTCIMVIIITYLYNKLLYEILYISHNMIDKHSGDNLTFPFDASLKYQLSQLPYIFSRGLFGPLLNNNSIIINLLFLIQSLMIGYTLYMKRKNIKHQTPHVLVFSFLILTIAVVTPNWGTLNRYCSIPIYLLLYFYSFNIKNEIRK